MLRIKPDLYLSVSVCVMVCDLHVYSSGRVTEFSSESSVKVGNSDIRLNPRGRAQTALERKGQMHAEILEIIIVEEPGR